MIAFPCSHCHTQLKVKDEIAGQQVRCPGCKHAQKVPVPVVANTVVEHQSPGNRPAALPVDATLPSSPGQAAPLPTARAATGQRYVVEGPIGRGGMGEVLRVHDREIRREVAVKYLLNQADDRQRTRFVEEAQITGQLEHPNIVPVHDLGVDGDGRLYFSMKMVKGRSLGQVFDALRRKDPAAAREFTLGRLLNVFLGIGNALAYAHSRGVIHRDLKPANVMVGDFGEVYVMDWGLAKAMGASEQPSAVTSVATSRGADANLTQDGAILGTPAYMSPEQALGQVGDLDQRSDIYSLGAILYEILTLTPPVGRHGDQMAVLVRVAEGAIDPPEARAPERARQGLIPPELSAVAMKALARRPDSRYQSVEAMQKDIQRFLEGRSVSARRDSAWELFKKLVKRNKGASAATAAALVVLAGVVGAAFYFNTQEKLKAQAARDEAQVARQKAEENHAAYLKEQEDKHARMKSSAPAFLRAARLTTAEKEFKDALAQVEIALEYDPDLTDAYLLRGQLLLGLERFDDAVAPLDEYLRRKPEDTQARKLARLAKKPEPDRAAYYLALNEVFQQQKADALAGRMTVLAERFVKPAREKLAVYRKGIEAAWKGFGERLTLNAGEFHLNLHNVPNLRDLSPLKDLSLPLSVLEFGSEKVESLEPLRGMPLTRLGMPGSFAKGSGVRDLGPLRGMKLKQLDLTFVYGISDLSPLEGMPLERLGMRGDGNVTDLTPLKGMPLTHLDFFDCHGIADLGPLQGMRLKSLSLMSCGKVKDIGPLAGQPIESLHLNGLAKIRDFEPLRGMPLRILDVRGCGNFRDLGVLKDAPLVELYVSGLPITDLSPLRTMKKLAVLEVAGCKEVRQFDALKDLPLTVLVVNHSPHFRDLSLVQGMKLRHLGIEGCAAIDDLTPLDGMQLKSIALTPSLVKKGWDVLERMKSLEQVVVAGKGMDVSDFWSRYKKGEFQK